MKFHKEYFHREGTKGPVRVVCVRNQLVKAPISKIIGKKNKTSLFVSSSDWFLDFLPRRQYHPLEKVPCKHVCNICHYIYAFTESLRRETFCISWNLEGFGPGVQSLDLVVCMGVMAPQDGRIAAAPAPPS